MKTRRLIYFVMVGVVISAAVLLTAQNPGSSAQDVRITNGPVIERADSTSATIAWSTNQPSSSRIYYATDASNLTEFAESEYSRDASHRVEIRGLKPNTTYFFQIQSARGQGSNSARGAGVMRFRTPGAGEQPIRNQKAEVYLKENYGSGKVRITNGPVVEHVGRDTVTVAWSTNLRGSSRVTYGNDPNNLTELAEAPWGKGGLTHRVVIRGLKPGSTYYFQVQTGQAEGTGGAETQSQKVGTFQTLQ